jgi:uncharacterized membrane protein YbhN (UPF0104 family)
MWENLMTLHRQARVAHGSLGPRTVFVADGPAADGSAADRRVPFTHFDYSSTMPTDQQLAADVVSLLATTATLAGQDRAITTAAEVVDADRLVAALPYLQVAVVEPRLRHSAKRADVTFAGLRSELAERLDVEMPEVAPARRVKWSDVAMAVFAIFAANALIAQTADVGLDTLLENLRTASVAWLVVAFGVRLVSYTTDYISLKAVVTEPLRFAPTTLLQPAKGLVGLVVPSMVGRVGLDIRYLQQLGVPTTTAATLGPVLGVIGMIAELVLVLLSARWIGQAVDTGELFDFDAGGLLAIAAFGVHVPFPALIFVSIGTGLPAGPAPVPGGIGVAQATMSGLLIGVGVDPALSVSIAPTYRMVTAYLPPLLGFFSMKWLTRESYL